jgi:ATP-dependent Clp protease ATP-binding subunit ClpA
VVVLSQDEARALKHNYIGTEHLLLGLLREEEGLAARLLESLDITVEEVRVQVKRVVGEGDEDATGHIPFTPGAKTTLELALREALSLGDNHIGTEHLLLGLVREGEGVAARILADFDANPRKVAAQLIPLLSGPSRVGYVESFPEHVPERATELEQARGRMARGVFEYSDSWWSPRAVLATGGAISLAGAALGLLAGWLIWG